MIISIAIRNVRPEAAKAPVGVVQRSTAAATVPKWDQRYRDSGGETRRLAAKQSSSAPAERRRS